ncbi:hypothetical protein [Metabacillus sp. RGM 3146]|uniref:hypothetical protein n=1 Tax=Metabacillus sp. RGM 3146 TaxID=3401092 RepID=UPI003B9C76E6
MVAEPQVFELGENLVAVFSVQVGECFAKVECLFSSKGVEDYTIEYRGNKDYREKVIGIALKEADSLFKEKLCMSFQK